MNDHGGILEAVGSFDNMRCKEIEGRGELATFASDDKVGGWVGWVEGRGDAGGSNEPFRGGGGVISSLTTSQPAYLYIHTTQSFETHINLDKVSSPSFSFSSSSFSHPSTHLPTYPGRPR